MKTQRLVNSVVMPCIGFGTADLTSNIAGIVGLAIRAGYRLLDTARVYGSEKGVGKAVADCIEAGICTREELFIQTKLNPEKHTYEGVFESFNESMEELKLSYIDQYLIHWPVPRGTENDYSWRNIEVWRAFEELYSQGKVRAVGLCNFLERHYLDIRENCKIAPMTNQIEIHPEFQQRGLVRFSQKQGMLIQAWSPMGRRLVTNSMITGIAKKYMKNSGQILLRWSIDSGFVPLSRSSNNSRITGNINIFDINLDEEDKTSLDAMNTHNNHLDVWAYKRQIMY